MLSDKGAYELSAGMGHTLQWEGLEEVGGEGQ